ncbi:hypothetical protein GYMLUDRAFT_943398 [Collybiopsis luxurians FD-317 M1]|uniref:Uncharacterized protein n=1 Tax=Collybiopsis luxurians FD-317 M1 TaxID=944289 RepID=A0A0D0BEZ3_9AGAR|nr:hypothetical protein GYMLUDRAFT_943398 [Collybiopsis luxurians FD-317 M1]
MSKKNKYEHQKRRVTIMTKSRDHYRLQSSSTFNIFALSLPNLSHNLFYPRFHSFSRLQHFSWDDGVMAKSLTEVEELRMLNRLVYCGAACAVFILIPSHTFLRISTSTSYKGRVYLFLHRSLIQQTPLSNSSPRRLTNMPLIPRLSKWYSRQTVLYACSSGFFTMIVVKWCR